jgi:hemoglobin
MKKQIEGHDDIKLLVDRFYEKVNADELIGRIFNEVAKVDWEHHLPKMYGFWNMILFGAPDYKGNTMGVHMSLNEKTPLLPEYFDRWIKLFSETVDEYFEGENAEEAKRRAGVIGMTMMYKLNKL